MHAWLEWARGPAFVFGFTFMLLGLARHVGVTIWEIRRTMRRAGDQIAAAEGGRLATLKWLVPVGKIVHEPLFALTSIVFHVAILVVPIFLAGHIALWTQALGFGWPAIPNTVADVLTIVAVVTAAGLIAQRLAARATRALSKPQDHAILILLALPFVTGFLVMHPTLNPFAFESTLLCTC